MVLVKEQYPARKIVMIFGNAANRLSKSSSTTYGDWCDQHGIAWVDIRQFEEDPHCLLGINPRKDGTSTGPRKRKKKR